MNKKISRKNFIRDFGLLTISAPGIAAAVEGNGGLSFADAKPSLPLKMDGEKDRPRDTRRGSWVRRGGMEKGDVVLAQSGKVCQLIVSEGAHSAVRQATRFLASDIEKISGLKPSVSNSLKGDSVKVILTTVGEGMLPPAMNVEDIKGKWEAFKIITIDNTVWLIGADFRGTAFAAYTLCERLGIDPLYIWTGFEPEKQEKLILKRTAYTTSSPTFKYRGFFHDDEDIHPRPFDYNGYPLQIGDIDILWYKRYFETALRLRMNMVAPYTRVHRRYEVQKCASDWGLFFTSHHYDILLSNPFGLKIFNLAEKRNVKPEWNWFANRKGMEKYWRAGVWENKDLNCIWPVGLRGTGDLAYPFPKGTTTSQEAKVYHDVIDTQINIAKKILICDQPPVYTLTLYNEMLDKYEKNKADFDLPEDVIVVWPDNYLGKMRKLPKSLGKWKHGVYYHLAVAGFDLTMQSANMVSPQTITGQFKKIVEAGATEYMLVNVSQLREYTMGARLLAEITWDASSILDEEDPGKSYINWWCNEYFGPVKNNSASKIYPYYYKLLYVPDILWFASNVVWKLLGRLVKKVAGEPYEPIDKKDIALLESRKKEFQAAMNIFSEASADMTYKQKRYFFETTKMGLCFDWRPTQAAFLLLKALDEKNTGKMWEYIFQSIKPLEQLELEIRRAERPPFDKWYRATWLRPKLTGRDVHRSYEAVRTFISTSGKSFIPFDDIHKYYSTKEYQSWNEFLEKSDKIGMPLS